MKYSKFKNSPAFKRTLKLNCIIVAVITVCLLLLSLEMRAMLQRNEKNSCSTTLSYGLTRLTEQISAANNSILTFRSLLTQGGVRELDKYDAINLLKIKSHLSTIVNDSGFIVDIALVYEEKDLVITANHICYSVDSFLSYYDIKGMDLSPLRQYTNEHNRLATSRFLPCESIYRITATTIDTAFCCAIPLDTERYTTSKGVAFIFLKQAELANITIPENLRPYAILNLYENRLADDGSPLMSFQGEKAADTHNFEVELVNEPGTLRAQVLISARYLDDAVRSFNNYIIIALFAVVLTGIGSALWSAYRQNLPVQQMLRHLRDRGLLISADENEYIGLTNSIETLLSEKSTISEQLSSYQSSLLSNLLDRLFSSTVLNPEVENTLLSEIEHFPQRSLVYCGKIYIFSADNNRSMELTLIMVLEYVRQHLPENAILHSTDTTTFGLIYPLDGDDGQDRLRAMLEGIPERFSARVVLSLGGRCEGLSQIGLSFERAQMSFIALNRRSGDQLILVPETSRDQALSMRSLQSVQQFLSAGDAQNACLAARDFLTCASDMQLINLHDRYDLLRAHILLVCREIAPDQPLPDVPAFNVSDGMQTLIDNLEKAILQTASCLHERQSSAHSDQFESMAAYLREHFQDPTLCSASVAYEFGVSEKYLFNLFKKRTGNSMTSCLHRIRMEEAARLLRECDDTIQEISTRVGFANFGTFFKAFKREYGVAPGKFREESRAQK